MKKSLILIVILIAASTLYSLTKSQNSSVDDTNFAAEEPNDDVVAETANDNCPDTAPTVIIAASADTVTHLVLLDGKAVSTITGNWSESEAYIFRQTKCNAWIAASATGRGGYILYGGDDQLYRLNFVDKSLTRVNFDGFLSDISGSESTIVSVSAVDGASGTQPSIEVTDIKSGTHVQYVVDLPYDTAGSAKFSPNGKKIAYAAVERDAESGDPIKTAIYIIDLDSGTQSMMGKADIRMNQAPYITGWLDNDTPIVSDTP